MSDKEALSATSKKVAIYVRVSTKLQVDKDSLSVQRRELESYSEMILSCSDYVVFEDAGYSAKNTERPDFQRMMERLRTGEFSHLLVWKIDRISRNLLDFAAMYSELKKLGITFISKNEQFDTSNAVGEAMLKIILIFAELERKMTSERVSAVMTSRAGNGQWNGGRVPYGYSYDKNEKVFSLEPTESEVVKMIFNMYERYRSLLYVARYLNNSNIRVRSGAEWSPTTVGKVLRSVFYIGSYTYNVRDYSKGGAKRDASEWTTVENHHPPIVSKEQFEKVAAILDKNRRLSNSTGKTYTRKNIHIFAGFLTCGCCGGNMSATAGSAHTNGWRPSIYGCSRRRNNSSACNNKFIIDTALGEFVTNYIANIIRLKGTVNRSTTLESLEKRILKGRAFENVAGICSGLEELREMLLSGESGFEYKPKIATSGADSKAIEKAHLEERHKKCDAAINRLKTLYLYGENAMSEAEYTVEFKKISKELETIEHRLAELKDIDLEMEMNPDFSEKASYLVMMDRLMTEGYINFEKFSMSVDRQVQRSFFMTIIDNIVITNGRVTSIRFKNGILNIFTYK